MIIAVTYHLETKEVFSHFGKTPAFLLYDSNTKECKIIGNGGFGHRDLVNYLASLGVNVVICGSLGRPAITLMEASRIEAIPGVCGNAEAALNAYLDGSLRGNQDAIHECGCHH